MYYNLFIFPFSPSVGAIEYWKMSLSHIKFFLKIGLDTLKTSLNIVEDRLKKKMNFDVCVV